MIGCRGRCGNAWWRDGSASCRSSRRGRTSGRAADAPRSNRSSGTPRSRARSGVTVADARLMGARMPEPRVPATVRPRPRRRGSARNACSVATTWAPSPTAAATRLTEPARTSPIAKTPARLVSSGRRPLPSSAARAHEALVVERHVGLRQPRGVRVRADEEKQMADRRVARLARGAWRQRTASSRRPLPFERGHLRLRAAPRHCGSAAMRSTR